MMQIPKVIGIKEAKNEVKQVKVGQYPKKSFKLVSKAMQNQWNNGTPNSNRKLYKSKMKAKKA